MQFSQKITPFLSFKDQAAEAAQFYVSVLPDAKILQTLTHPETKAVLTVEFQMGGLNFVALNVGEPWSFTEAISLAVACETQEEIDTLWQKLSDGGREVQCGWLQDRYGLSWQIVPAMLSQWLDESDPETTLRVLNAVWQMTKLDIAQLQAAYENK